jgi:hypothetical protein
MRRFRLVVCALAGFAEETASRPVAPAAWKRLP